jgi:hypothetical protein
MGMLIGTFVKDIMYWLIGVYLEGSTGRLLGVLIRRISSSPVCIYSIIRRLICVCMDTVTGQ